MSYKLKYITTVGDRKMYEVLSSTHKSPIDDSTSSPDLLSTSLTHTDENSLDTTRRDAKKTFVVVKKSGNNAQYSERKGGELLF